MIDRLVKLTRLAEESRQLAIITDRNYLAREIHDTLAQGFAGILMQLQATTRLLHKKPEQAQIHLARAQDLARSGLAEARFCVGVATIRDCWRASCPASSAN